MCSGLVFQISSQLFPIDAISVQVRRTASFGAQVICQPDEGESEDYAMACRGFSVLAVVEVVMVQEKA